ncbi:MAG TPA: OPT/YSL family transporter [Dermatophilaceae bacterium]|nr:OPT/YSL family transporter [Dermatophilaceae bacterium]HQH91721.1 OPT/YSL family transporter [Dermatophilaceae bacterium]HQK61530.1 OPT/YSL family transporter [Dermatophilaceae bacterium]
MAHDTSATTDQVTERHPRALAPANLILTVLLSVFGALIGIQIIATLGITPSTSLLGALVAMTLSRIPLTIFRGFRNIHAQNLAQTSISSATFGAANSLFLPIGIPFLFGQPSMIMPMLIGVAAAMLLDAWLLYRMFDTPAFPARRPWPLGIAAAEAIKAGDQGGAQAKVLFGGIGVGTLGAIFSLPMSAFGVAMIGGFGAMMAFGIGLLTRAYAKPVAQIDLMALYIPHGMMIGAGLVALVQVGRVVVSAHRNGDKDMDDEPEPTSTGSKASASSAGSSAASTAVATADPVNAASRLGQSLRVGGIGYLIIAALLAFGTGVFTQMSTAMLISFVLYATVAAFVHELIVGIAAMHSGWFPAFAVALITLIIGIMIGFPPAALVVLAGFTAATGPAFADMGYDLKAGYVLRGGGIDPAFELDGRRQQLIAAMVGFGVAIIAVAAAYPVFFGRNMTAPIDAAYIAAIKAGVSGETARSLVIWAIPGAIIQFLGGSRRQLGVLFATGLLISTPLAGWMVAGGLVVRIVASKVLGPVARERLEVFAGGVIAGDALYSFFSGAVKSLRS